MMAHPTRSLGPRNLTLTSMEKLAEHHAWIANMQRGETLNIDGFIQFSI